MSERREPGIPASSERREPGGAELAEVAGWLHDARQIVVLTGAGMSTESGIPDFRGPQGVWTRDPTAERLAHIDHYVASSEGRRARWRDRVKRDLWVAEPNAGHRALAELERRAAVHTLATQNVDGLHQRAGSSPGKVIELHGTVHLVKCLSCGRRDPIGPTLDRVRAGDDDPACLACGGILKSATVSFGESLVEADLRRAQDAAAGADVFIAAGTSLAVYPAAQLPGFALANRARLVICNAEPTPYDADADVVVRERLGTALPALVELV